MTARRSLRDRNRAAIALDPEPTDVDHAAEPRSSDQQEPPARAAGKRRPLAERTAGPTARLGIYLTPAEFDAANLARGTAVDVRVAKYDGSGKVDVQVVASPHTDMPPLKAVPPPIGVSAARTFSTKALYCAA